VTVPELPGEARTELDALRPLVGRHLGYSDWLEISQERVDRFAEAVGDHQWIHTDGQRAAGSRFGATIAHGFLILSLASRCLREILPSTGGGGMSLNYGCERVRFLAPVHIGTRVRAGATLESIDEVRGGGVQLLVDMIFSVEDRKVPACIAKIILRNYGGWD
jgi:acyl dehydratase